MTPRPFVLAETTWPAASAAGFDAAVLPWGATEAHNRHLPYATDALETERIAIAAAELAWKRGAKIVVLPTVPFGVHTAQRDIPFCLNMNPTTQLALLRDVAQSLVPHGVRKLVILNGHGANEFRWMIRELQGVVPLFLCTVNWYAVLDPKTYFTEPGDHGGELETSVTMHLAPELVRPLNVAGPGRARAWRIAALREGWAWAPRQWSKVTDDTGVGNPAAATAAKGARYVKDVTAKIADFLVELGAADPDDLYA